MSPAAPTVHYSPPWANTHVGSRVRISPRIPVRRLTFCNKDRRDRRLQWLWKDVSGSQDRRSSQPAVGRDFVYGMPQRGHTTCIYRSIKRLLSTWMTSKDSFYKTLTPEQSKLAFANEYDFDAPSSIDFDILVEKLRDLKQGLVATSGRSEHRVLRTVAEPHHHIISRRKAEIPAYSFEKHQRQPQTTTIYSCHVLVLEGIFALYDPRVLDLLDMKVQICLRLETSGVCG